MGQHSNRSNRAQQSIVEKHRSCTDTLRLKINRVPHKRSLMRKPAAVYSHSFAHRSIVVPWIDPRIIVHTLELRPQYVSRGRLHVFTGVIHMHVMGRMVEQQSK